MPEGAEQHFRILTRMVDAPGAHPPSQHNLACGFFNEPRRSFVFLEGRSAGWMNNLDAVEEPDALRDVQLNQ